MASILTHKLGSELTANCHKNHNGTDSLHDRIDGYTNKYNTSNRCENLGSKQCRYEIETTGKLPDDQRSGKRKDVTWGNPRNWLGLGFLKLCEELAVDQ